MTTSLTIGSGRDIRKAMRLLLVGLCALPILGALWAESTDAFISYMMVTVLAFVPSILWLRMGAPGIPVFPVVSAVQYIYFALPVLRQTVGPTPYEPWEIMRASLTVTLFLACATAAWWWTLGRSVRHFRVKPVLLSSQPKYVLVVLGGLAFGLVFQILLILGMFTSLGSFFSVVRSVALTATSISCYMAGYCRGARLLRGPAWPVALAGMGLIIILSWSSLFLVSGISYAMAGVLGYAITTKRIPWNAILPAVLVIFVLHAGKAEMRSRYWNINYENEITIGNVPDLLTEWFVDGIDAIENGTVRQDIFERASLLYLMLRVQRFSPDEIPFLNGETYALLPLYLIPRFLYPDKPTTQSGLSLLNVRYGLQSTITTKSTTIGWGTISEGYANFGYEGVVVVALIYGALAGFFTRISFGKSALSLPTLLAVASLIIFINLEDDFAYLLTNLFQALIAATIFYIPLRLLSSVDNMNSSTQQRYVFQNWSQK
jgi:hypothetical protein